MSSNGDCSIVPAWFRSRAIVFMCIGTMVVAFCRCDDGRRRCGQVEAGDQAASGPDLDRGVWERSVWGNEVSGRKMTWPEIEDAIRSSMSDAGKWALIEDFYEGRYRPPSYPGTSAQYAVKRWAFSGSPGWRFWWEYRRLFLRKVPLDVTDLEFLGTLLGYDDDSDGRRYFRDGSYREVGQTWLRALTGVEFGIEAEFIRWLGERKSRLVWDRTKLIFVAAHVQQSIPSGTMPGG